MVSIGSISGRVAGAGNPGTGIDARLAAIRQRLEPGGAVNRYQSALAFDATSPDPLANGFDPFGAAYQAALEAKAAMPSASGSAGVAGVAGAYGIESLQSIGPTGASVGRIGGFGPMLVPSALQLYGNGRVPPEALQPIEQAGHRLFAPAADAWMAAVDAAAADGITLRITDSYRTYDQQVDLVRRKGLYSEGGYGATPGTSNHGWGLAVDADVTDPATLNWLRTNAHRFGYVEAVPREPWHWEFRPHQA